MIVSTYSSSEIWLCECVHVCAHLESSKKIHKHLYYRETVKDKQLELFSLNTHQCFQDCILLATFINEACSVNVHIHIYGVMLPNGEWCIWSSIYHILCDTCQLSVYEHFTVHDVLTVYLSSLQLSKTAAWDVQSGL